MLVEQTLGRTDRENLQPRMSAFAVPLVLLAVAFELMSDKHLGYVMFFTPAIILLYGASKKGWDVVGLAGNE